jgi:hypothetical protein
MELHNPMAITAMALPMQTAAGPAQRMLSQDYQRKHLGEGELDYGLHRDAGMRKSIAVYTSAAMYLSVSHLPLM